MVSSNYVGELCIMEVPLKNLKSKYKVLFKHLDQELADSPIRYLAKRRFLPTRRDLQLWPYSLNNAMDDDFEAAHLNKRYFLKSKRYFLNSKRDNEKRDESGNLETPKSPNLALKCSIS
ncbi:unnamed protein product [Didymodactylos carnosus]|uniref:Uncharacterized protein n=1 Tax=Didymodactylos carnosus TaxID=1234261 RepID=A0A814DH89_9BILA|nr:unnamed protein product [Didymodactylos carnosus]CAF1026552.1 unnamed protein product [Didymodactylos carnosus]CAF3728482.1 unnamed protein product [Didymodactylos carnosus]CAF3795016.1 unnamed protein product [Didymodactylos carnosus]